MMVLMREMMVLEQPEHITQTQSERLVSSAESPVFRSAPVQSWRRSS
jgi:hypothetical protein